MKNATYRYCCAVFLCMGTTFAQQGLSPPTDVRTQQGCDPANSWQVVFQFPENDSDVGKLWKVDYTELATTGRISSQYLDFLLRADFPSLGTRQDVSQYLAQVQKTVREAEGKDVSSFVLSYNACINLPNATYELPAKSQPQPVPLDQGRIAELALEIAKSDTGPPPAAPVIAAPQKRSIWGTLARSAALPLYAIPGLGPLGAGLAGMGLQPLAGVLDDKLGKAADPDDLLRQRAIEAGTMGPGVSFGLKGRGKDTQRVYF